jgi:signal transduction histidine kinase
MIVAQHRLVALHQEHTRGLLRAQEEERAWVAREVHDDAVQRLAALHHELRQLQRSTSVTPDVQQRQLDGLVAEVEDLSAALRQLAHRLHPAAIEQAGLVAALRQLTDEVSRTAGLPIDVRVPAGKVQLPTPLALTLFRIAQEALRNAVRHAAASRVVLSVDAAADAVELRVEDDGRGMGPEANRTGGIGLISMRERARLVGGEATFRDRDGGGTVVAARVPRSAAVA